MIKLVFYWLLTALTLMLVALIMPGIYIHNFTAALIATVIMGVINVSVKPILLLLTLPISLLTLGLFAFVVNAAMFGLAAWFVPGFEVTGFWSALFGSLLLALLTSFLNGSEMGLKSA